MTKLMDNTAQTHASEEMPQQPHLNPHSPQPPTRKKLNWKGFFIGIIIVILIEIFAVNALQNDKKQAASIHPTPTTDQTAKWKTFSGNSFSINYPSGWMTSSSIDFTRMNNENKIVMIYDGKLNSHVCNSDKPYPSRFIAISSITTQESPKDFATDRTWGDDQLKVELLKEMNITNYSINNASGVIYNDPGECGRGTIIALSNGKKIFLLNIPGTSPKTDSQINQILSTFKFTDTRQMAGNFIWNVPTSALSLNEEKELQSAFAALQDTQQNNATHLSVDAIHMSSESSNFAIAQLTVRNHDNSIVPTDGIEYYLQKTNGKWQIIIGGDKNFCQKVKVFPKDLLDATSYYNYYGCPK